MKNKIAISLSTILVLLTISAYSNSFESIFSGHWAEKHIEPDFYETYFEKHVSSLQSEFLLNGAITKGDFYSILGCLTQETVTIPLTEEEKNKPLLRKTAVMWLINAIEDEERKVVYDEKENMFIDIKGLEKSEKESVLRAHSIGLINGYSERIFAPNDKVTYAQAMILMQRLNNKIMITENTIPFVTIETIQEHTARQEGLFVSEKEDKIIITVVQRFNTSGYQLEVANIVKLGDAKYAISLNITKPDPKHMVLQVISFVRTTIEIDKKHVDSNYTFEVLNLPKGVER
ncbi:S-layer homology domain-containing protein [Alkaliphilus sp. AH-315-G20]|nr:S-layer homology domain-containing protein [Alkaliphilus sp. AH-315-G20]